jgi:hypothetical protein
MMLMQYSLLVFIKNQLKFQERNTTRLLQNKDEKIMKEIYKYKKNATTDLFCT